MRQFANCMELIQELPREVMTRGQLSEDKSVQGKDVSNDKDFLQKEIDGVAYTINSFHDVEEMLEHARKIFGKTHLRKEVGDQWVWDMFNNLTTKETWFEKDPYTIDYFNKFCNDNNTGASSYGYGERIIPQLDSLIKRLKKNIYARGAYIAIHDARDIHRTGHRIPCSLSYGCRIKKTLDGNKMNLYVHMRSQDVANFMALDIYKACKFLEYVADKLEVRAGKIVCYVDSLHLYNRDIKDLNIVW